MTKEIKSIFVVLLTMISITGCGPIGEKTTSMSIIYGIAVAIAILMLCVYCAAIKEKSLWMVLLFSSILVVNIGYLTLSISDNLEEALLSNRIAYLGSVFLPMAMFMIIINACGIKYKKFFPFVLIGIGIVVFFIAASPGYLDIYYKDVEFSKVNGVTVLDKTYGPLHCIYLFYLLSYFGLMVAVIIHSSIKKKIGSVTKRIILLGTVSINIGVWLLEQLVSIEFEFLSISYIISEFFLLSLYLLNQEEAINDNNKNIDDIKTEEEQEEQKEQITEELMEIIDKCKEFDEHLVELTKTEKRVYDMYIDDMTPEQIIEELHITNNTLKFHNKNIYSKLNVNSRKQLIKVGKVHRSGEYKGNIGK